MEHKIILDTGSFYLKYGSIEMEDKIKMERGVVNNGVIINQKKIERLWDELFKTMICKKSDVIICEPIIFGDRNRELLRKMLIGRYHFKSVKFFNQQLLALYALGTNTGVVVDIGYSSTRIVPIYDGIVLERGICMSSLCKKNYKDSTFIINPDQLDLDCETIPELIRRSIDLSPIDLRKQLYNSIYIVGGGSMVSGIAKEIIVQLRGCSTYRYKIKIRAPRNRDILAWKGAQMLCMLKVI